MSGYWSYKNIGYLILSSNLAGVSFQVLDKLRDYDLSIGIHFLDLSIVVEHFHLLEELLFEAISFKSFNLGGPVFIVLRGNGPRASLTL
jgi:hypothetical protein